MGTKIICFLIILAVDTTASIDTTATGYKIGMYLGGFLPFIALLIIFLLFIRGSYRFKNK